MSNADLLAEAVDTAVRLFYAGAAWLLLTALAATLALHTVLAIVWSVCRWAWNLLRRRHNGPSWARGRLRARHIAHARARRSQSRTRPRWANTQPIDHDDYREAA